MTLDSIGIAFRNLFMYGLFFAFSATAIWAFIYWWKKDRYTRERFAFFGLVTLASLASLILLQVASNTNILQQIVGIIAYWALGKQLPSAELTPTATLVQTSIFVVLALWLYLVHAGWNGLKSKAQYEQEQQMLRPNPLRDIALLLSTEKASREKLSPYHRPDLQAPPILDTAERARIWHELVRDLWTLRNRHAGFDNLYDQEHACWWGADKRTNALICLACHQDPLPQVAVDRLIAVSQEIAMNRGQAATNIILASKSGTIADSRTYANYTVARTNYNALLNQLIDFSDYFADIRGRVELARLPDSPLTIDDVYTPPSIRLNPTGECIPQDVETYINGWLSEESTRQLALLGEYGQGKSTASLMLAYHLIRRILAGDGSPRIPILIELRGKSPRSLTPSDLLATWGHRYGIDVRALLQLIIAGRVLLIFEGFDEIDLTGDSEGRVKHFRTLWQLNYQGAKLLITGRPNFFLDDAERKRALGIQTPNPTRPYCEAILLAPFTIGQMKSSLRAAEQQTRTEIIDLAKRNAKFYEIVSRPSLLFIVSTLWKRERLSEKSDQISSAYIMDLFIRHSYRRQGAKQAERDFMALNTAERAYFMSGIAAYMAVHWLPNQISSDQLNDAIRQLVDSIPDSVSQIVGTMEDEVMMPLRNLDRFDWTNRAAESLEHISNDVRACGILVSDLSKDGTFKFAHKSFAELLQAQLALVAFSGNLDSGTQALSIINTFHAPARRLLKTPEAGSFLAEMVRDELATQGIFDDVAVARRLLEILVVGSGPMAPIRRFQMLFAPIAIAFVHMINAARYVVQRRIDRGLVSHSPQGKDHAQLPKQQDPRTLRADSTLRYFTRLADPSSFLLFSTAIIGLALGFTSSISRGDKWIIPVMAFLSVPFSLLLGTIDFLVPGLHFWYWCCSSIGVSMESISRVVGPGVARHLARSSSKDKEDKGSDPFSRHRQ